MGKITVYTTLTNNSVEFESTGTTWKEVQREMVDLRINYSGMKAVIGESRLTLESEKAVVPQEGFTLYLMPVKTKSGADRKELFAQMKAAVESKQASKEQFMVDGKNMTQLSTDKLVELWAKFQGSGASTAPAKASDVKPSKETKKETSTKDVAAKAPVLTVKEQANNILSEIGVVLEEEDVDSDVSEVILAKVRLIIGLFSDVKEKFNASTGESESARVAREEREAKDAKNKALKAAADDLMRDFSDVKR